MEKAIQHKDNTLINAGEWPAIKANARAIANRDLLPLPIPRDVPLSMKKKTKTFFTKYHFKHWTDAVLKLEEQEPLLTLCATHWKAEHILNAILTGASDQKASMSKEDTSDLDDPAISLPTPSLMTNPSGSKRCLSNLSPTKPKKKKKTGKERGAKDSEKCTSIVFFYIVSTTDMILVVSPPSIIIDNNIINKQLSLATENTGTATTTAQSRDEPNPLPAFSVPTAPEHIDINFIDVNPSHSSLKGKLHFNFCLIHAEY